MTLLQRLADRVWAAALAFVLPWSSRSQHDSYLRGYKDGLKDGKTRRDLLGPGR